MNRSVGRAIPSQLLRDARWIVQLVEQYLVSYLQMPYGQLSWQSNTQLVTYRCPMDSSVGRAIRSQLLRNAQWIAQLVERQTEKPGAMLTLVRVPGRYGKDIFFQSPLSVQILLRCVHSPRVKSHASTSARALTIGNNGSHIPFFGPTKTSHK